MGAVGRSVIVVAMLALAAPVVAQDALPPSFELPWTDVAPHVEGSAVRAAAIGTPDERIGRFDPRRESARRQGRARALDAIHRWADDALARLRADPRTAQAVHAAIDAHASVEGVRPLVDGAGVVVVAVPVSALRGACGMRGAPWSA